MRTYLQKKLTGLEGQVVVFDRNGEAQAGDFTFSMPAQLCVTLVRAGVTGPIDLTAVCGGRTVRSLLADGEESIVINVRDYGLWTVTAAPRSGSLLNTRAEVQVDQVKQYPVLLGAYPELGRNTPEVIRDAARLGVAKDYWSVGDTVDLTLDGGEQVTMQLADYDHDTLTEGGKAYMTFVSRNALEEKHRHYEGTLNHPGWNRSLIRTFLNGACYDRLPQGWKNVIRETTRITSVGNGVTGLEQAGDKLFLLCEEEVFGTHRYAAAGEGRRYPVFTDDNSRMKNSGGSSTLWWLRSPEESSPNNYCAVTGSGQLTTSGASGQNGVVFAFCI